MIKRIMRLLHLLSMYLAAAVLLLPLLVASPPDYAFRAFLRVCAWYADWCEGKLNNMLSSYKKRWG